MEDFEIFDKQQHEVELKNIFLKYTNIIDLKKRPLSVLNEDYGDIWKGSEKKKRDDIIVEGNRNKCRLWDLFEATSLH